MNANNKDITNTNFNNGWKCYYQLSDDKGDEKTILAAANNVETDYRWSSVELPHIVDPIKQQKQKKMISYRWWYSKQIDWILTDKWSEQQIHLMFESCNGLNNNSTSSIINATIWLNSTQIFSGLLMPLSNQIELPLNLLHSQNSEESKCNNTLTISCSDTSLSLHARLILRGKIIYATGQVNVDEELVNKSKDSKKVGDDALDYTVSVDDDGGRIDVVFNSKKKYNASIKPSPPATPFLGAGSDGKQRDEHKELKDDYLFIPRLAIVILIVGTRGDVQPFIALGQALKASGHRVRLATHEVFRSFVCGNGLEFYPLAGDPADLISFMVKNAGIIPSVSSIIEGDVGKKRRCLADILASTWQACIANDDETDVPFIAEVIIANPPSFGHIHCAEKLQIPLHIMFTMPWSPTTAFAHPLSNIDSSTGSKKTINRYSYDVIETLTWTGLRDIVNDFRKKTLGLSSLNTSQAIYALSDEQVPHTYCWSPSLVSKPLDWGPHIDISGFFFLDLGSAYVNPPQDLLNFLGLNDNNCTTHKLPPPIYIGFGSIAGHDSRRILTVVVDALTRTGYRAILSGLASDTDLLPPNIFKVGNVPHDWLFQHVSAVCHHGGAGTLAAGLRAGKPTIIVPFFGDQFFWGTVVEKSGSGPHPIPGKSITVNQLIEAFHFVHKPTTHAAAERLRDSILKENGCAAAVYAFHTKLPLTRMHSDLEPTFPACYRSDKYNIQISRPVAQVLVSTGLIEESQLRPHIIKEWKFMYDNHMHILMHGLLVHSRKAFSTTFIDTACELKRSASTNNMSTRTLEGVRSVTKGLGLGVGHLAIGYLSLYGELTDVLDRVVYLYDPYSSPKERHRPRVTDFTSGAKAAGLALWNGCKDGVTGMIKSPYAGYKRHGALGGAAGTLLASVNIGVKPAVGILASLTWLSRGTYASIKTLVENYKKEGRHISFKLIDVNASLSTENNAQTKDEDDKRISSAAKSAATISGFHPKICQHIIDEFEAIKIEYEQKKTSSSRKKRNPVSFFSYANKKRQSSVPDISHSSQ